MAITAEYFEFFLDLLTRTWTSSVDDYIAEWDTYDDDEKLIHVEDFGAYTSKQADIDEYVSTHSLTPTQARRYRELCDLIASKHAQMTAMGFRLWPLVTSRARGRPRRVA